MKNIKRNITRPVILTAVIALLLAGGAFALFVNRDTNDSQGGAESSGINYNPPTEKERSAGDEQKEQLTEGQNNQSNNEPSNTQKTANVIVTYAEQNGSTIEVNAFVNNVYQDGTCTITFRKGSATVTKDTPAYRDASTTICTNPLFDRSEFPSTGDWQLTVSYKSKDAAGQSNPQTVTIR